MTSAATTTAPDGTIAFIVIAALCIYFSPTIDAHTPADPRRSGHRDQSLPRMDIHRLGLGPGGGPCHQDLHRSATGQPLLPGTITPARRATRRVVGQPVGLGAEVPGRARLDRIAACDEAVSRNPTLTTRTRQASRENLGNMFHHGSCSPGFGRVVRADGSCGAIPRSDAAPRCCCPTRHPVGPAGGLWRSAGGTANIQRRGHCVTHHRGQSVSADQLGGDDQYPGADQHVYPGSGSGNGATQRHGVR